MSTITSLASAATASSSAASVLDAAGTTSSASAASASLTALLASASAALASEAALASGKKSTPKAFTYAGIALAVASGLFIGSSFVFKKKGLLQSQAKFGQRAGEGHAYLKSWLWWTGMVLMILGEVLNLVALSISSALLVTPLGALSVVVCAILSSIFLKEKLTLFGKVGAFLCIVGSTGIALNAPVSHAAGDIVEFMHLFIAPGFLVWMSLCIIASVVLVFFVAPRYGKTQVMVHITICSLTGGLSVSCISGIGSAVILTIRGDMQLKHWFFYFLLVFVVITLLVEINYLNKALELFNTAMVTPTYYVVFTFCTLVSSIILFQGLDTTATGIITIVLCFLTICSGITLLQLSKIDPADLTNADGSPLDRETTLLIRASRSHLAHEKGLDATAEDPGPDAVRGGLGVLGSMVRARSARRLHASSDAYAMSESGMLNTSSSRDLQRFELSDSPMRRSSNAASTLPNMPYKRDTAISFTEESKQPHGHHAGEAAWRTEGAHAGMGAIREGSDDTRDTDHAAPSIRPVNALRTMWDEPQPRDSYDHSPAALDEESHDRSPEEGHSHKFFPQPRRNDPDYEEASQLLRPRSGTVDSDDEEERQKGRAARRK